MEKYDIDLFKLIFKEKKKLNYNEKLKIAKESIKGLI